MRVWCLVVLCTIILPGTALINHVSIVDDPRHGFLINRFGLSEGGYIIIDVSNFLVRVKANNLTHKSNEELPGEEKPEYGFLIHVKDRSDLAFDLKVRNNCLLRSGGNKTFVYPLTSR